MRENEENWQVQLNTVLIEVIGLQELFSTELNFLILISKLKGLYSEPELEFFAYRKIIFESISLLRESIR